MSRFKKLDLYRDIPKDLTEPTLVGAIVSVVCTLIMVYLFLSEFMSYLTPMQTSEMFVDSPPLADIHGGELQINMNITMPNVPCAILSVDAQDIMGTHVVDVGGELHKTRLDAEGNIKLDHTGAPAAPETEDPTEQQGEGCNVHGNMIVKKVPGNFHVSAHAHANLLPIFFPNSPMNVSHLIHDLSFGVHTDKLSRVERAVTNPLKGTKRYAVVDDPDPETTISYEYYIKIVPTQYAPLSGEVYDSFQFVVNSNEIVGRYRLPAVYFRYDLSPITVKFVDQRKFSFAHFLVQVCAIIGGVFTVMGLLNAVLRSSVNSLKQMMKKAEMGKLG